MTTSESSGITLGDRVRVLVNGDGPDGVVGVVDRVFRSGRVLVTFPDGSFRNFHPANIEVIR